MTSSKVLNAIAILLGCIESRDWETFKKLTLSNRATFRALCKSIARCEELHGMTLLHAVARYDAPLDVVTEMIDICPTLPSSIDCLGRTPLHVAAGLGASPELIKLIAHSWPAGCDAKDDDGKTPLHFACDTSCELFEDDSNNKTTSHSIPNYESIRALLSESLRPVTMEDLDEMNPLEYAILSDAEMKTVQLLQKAAAANLESMPRSRSNSPMSALPASVSAKSG